MRHYGYGLQEGFLGMKSLNDAMEMYKKALDLGESEAMVHFGVGLEKGFLGHKDLTDAIKYYKKASDLGHTVAIFNYVFL
jgi:TPR repeat protein